MRLKAITFDLDDTLWPVDPVIRQAECAMHEWLAANCPEVAERYDVETMRALRRRIGAEHPHLAHDFSALRRHSLERALHEHGYDGEHVNGAFDAFFAARQEVTLFEDAIPVLERLRGEYRLGSISNGNADLEVIGLAHLFPVRVHARHLGHAKPAPEIFRAACERLGCEPGQVLHVGDDPALDVAGARAAGMQAVWANRAAAPWSGPGGAPPTIKRLSELPALLSGLG